MQSLPLRPLVHTEWLLFHYPGIGIGPVNDGGCYKVPLAFRIGTSDSNFPVLFGDIGEEALDSLILHLVLDRTEIDIRVGSRTDLAETSEPMTVTAPRTYLQILCCLDHCCQESVRNLFVDKDSFECQADLCLSSGQCVHCCRKTNILDRSSGRPGRQSMEV